MKIGSIELDDWTVTTTGEPVRYSINYRSDVDACIVLWREYIDDEKYVWVWKPMFNHKLHFLNEILA